MRNPFSFLSHLFHFTWKVCSQKSLHFIQVIISPEDLDRRHRIEHLGLAEESHLIRASKLNLALSFFVSHLYFYAKTYTESILGPKRTNRWTPLTLASKHGLRWSLHQVKKTGYEQVKLVHELFLKDMNVIVTVIVNVSMNMNSLHGLERVDRGSPVSLTQSGVS